MQIPQRHAVRLGLHGGQPIFGAAAGLHEPVMGLAVVGPPGDPDPDVMFEEHGIGAVCAYVEAHRDAELNPQLGPRDVLSPAHRLELVQRTQSPDNETKFHAVASAFALENADVVNQMLGGIRQSVAPTGGSVWIVQNTRRYQRRRAMIRIQHAAQAQPDRAFAELIGDPQPLEEHAAGADTFVQHFYEPALLLASPFTLGVIASRAVPDASETYTLIIAIGPGHGVPLRESDERTWSDVFGGSSMYRDHRMADEGWIRDTNLPLAAIPFEVLIPWWTGRLNALLTEVTDLGRYRLPDGLFDARGAYREARTLDRVFHTCTRIALHPREHVIRVAAAFELFDLIPQLATTAPGARTAWASLLNPERSREILGGAFDAAPDALRAALDGKTEAVWALLLGETQATVVPGRLAGDFVDVGAGGQMPLNEYTGRLFQSLRDTHHGYELSSQWKRDVLDTHTGHVSVALPELAVLYVMALLADPFAALSGRWYG